MAITTHVITGDRVQVAAAVDRARADGRLVEVTEATVLPGGRVQLVAALRTRGGSRWQQVRPWLIGVAKVVLVLVVLAAVAGVLWVITSAVLALMALVAAAVAWVHAHLLSIGLAVVAAVIGLAAASSGGGHRCVGAHCRGCRR
jgi:hypothetical protein